jgi:pyruvate dehydrogenase (quinone)
MSRRRSSPRRPAAGRAAIRRAAAALRAFQGRRVTWELSSRLPDDVIVTSDSGSCANWYARDLKMRRGMKASLSGGLASMGAAVPYAIAAKFAHPDRPVVGLVGDGAMQMSNMAELITVAKYWREWADGRWVMCVFKNEDLNQVTWEQRVMEGDPKFDASQKIPNVPYHQFAEMIGLKGIYLDDPEKLGRLGTKPWRRGVRSCWKSRRIRRFLRCRPTSPWIRRKNSRKA